MGRIKGRREETAGTLKSRSTEKEDEDQSLSANVVEEGDGEANGKFFACYLLTSLSPRFKGHTYIGFTVNPRRRIRQHNGEITSGAWRTKRRRPWEMVLCIYGFPTNVAALQFEWAWQHPVESLAVRQAAATFKSLSGLANKIKLAYTMLNLPSWQSLNLTVNYFSTKYIKHAASCPNLPEPMRVQVCTMDELPCYTRGSFCEDENDELHSADDDCEQSGGSQESTENELVEAQKLNDVAVVQDAVEHDEHDWDERGGECTKRAVLDRMKISRLSEKLCKGSLQHDQNSDEELPFSLSGLNKIITNAEDVGIFRLSDKLQRQPKNWGAGEKEVHEQSLQFNGCSVKLPSLSVSSCNNLITIAEDTEIISLHDDLVRHRKNGGHKRSFQPYGCPVRAPSLSVSTCDKISTIAEHKERIFRLLDACMDEHDQGVEHQQARENIVSDKVQCASISSDVEVIDVFTPSPCHKASSKKRRRSETEIIDLTVSPLLV